MSPQPEVYRFGDFTYRFTKEACDFYVAQGYPREMAEKMIDTKMFMKIVDMSKDKDGKEGKHKICCHFQIEGLPELSSCFMAIEGVKNNLNLPHMGGRVMSTFKKTDKGYETQWESKIMGNWKIKQDFTEEGINSVSSKDGKSFTEHWKRVMHVDGFYKTVKMDKVEQFLKKLGYPDHFVAGMDTYKFSFKTWDSGMKMSEWWGDFAMSTQCKFDEETEYKFPQDKNMQEQSKDMWMPKSKYIFSKTGNGKYTWIQNDEEGRSTEWKFTFNGDKCWIYGRNLNTSDTCSFEMKREYLPIMGSWKVASISGLKELMTTIGFPKEQVQNFANERVEFFIDEKGPMTHWIWKSQFNPMDVTFKFDEEFEYYDAYLKEKVKCIASKNNNRMKMLTHSSHGCWETKVTAGNDFMVVKTWMKGLDCMPMTYMFTRQSWMPRKWNPYQKEGFGQFGGNQMQNQNQNQNQGRSGRPTSGHY